MSNKNNPLIADTALETVQNVAEAMNELMILLSAKSSGLCLLMQPLLHALEHVADNGETIE